MAEKIAADEIRRVRKILNSFCILKKERDERQTDYEEYLCDVYNPIQGVVLDGLPRGKGLTSDPTGNYVVCMEPYFESYQRALDRRKKSIDDLEERMFKIERAVNKLEYQQRYVLYLKYIKGISWAKLPEHTGYQNTQNRMYEALGIGNIVRMGLL